MAATPITVPFLQPGLSYTVSVIDPATMTQLESVALTTSTGLNGSVVGSGTVNSAASGALLFDVLLANGDRLEHVPRVTTIADSTDNFLILSGLPAWSVLESTTITVPFLQPGLDYTVSVIDLQTMEEVANVALTTAAAINGTVTGTGTLFGSHSGQLAFDVLLTNGDRLEDVPRVASIDNSGNLIALTGIGSGVPNPLKLTAICSTGWGVTLRKCQPVADVKITVRPVTLPTACGVIYSRDECEATSSLTEVINGETVPGGFQLPGLYRGATYEAVIGDDGFGAATPSPVTFGSPDRETVSSETFQFTVPDDGSTFFRLPCEGAA